VNRSSFRRIARNPLHWISCGFGTGFVPKVPGTAGTLVAVPIVLLIQSFPTPVHLTILVLMFVLGCIVCQFTALALNQKDPGAVVWDEITGFCIAMAFIPATWTLMILAFVIFRLLDIFKPWPISLAEKKVAGGIGIMLDDLIAGVLTNLFLQVLIAANVL
jgi:phosphatidylglycerophosphatase A